MYNNFFAIDPMAATSYGMYNSVKGEEGSFVDFLLSYDSKAANENDNSWLNDLVNDETLSKIQSPEMLQALNLTGISTMDFLSQKSYFDTQAEGYKLMLKQEMLKRDIPIS
ncbi:hypothetical protein [Sulfurospirillum arcachonense]|uniref:hypothetical protein n=1 Tax=Sulfurospirillum arcachonense TaxID=57666 RepID=UPI0004687E02|nr:hypothetical protein [Sulfurospirillum arcachonense]